MINFIFITKETSLIFYQKTQVENSIFLQLFGCGKTRSKNHDVQFATYM